MFKIERLTRFARKVLWAVLPSLVVVLVLSFITQILARPEDLHKLLSTWQFWLRVVLGIVPLLLAILTAFLLAARFLRAVNPRLRWLEAVKFILFSRFGRPSFGPWMKIQGGKITMPENSVLTRIGGPGSLILAGDNAVVLERGGVFTSVQGPGFPQLGPFERVYDILDLGPKRTCYTVTAMSREGILLDWTVEVQYQLADGGKPLSNGAFYPLSPDDVFRASTSKWIREDDWKFGQDMDWEGLIVISQAEGTLRSILARRPLDQLIGITEKEEQAARIAIQKELEDDLRAYAPKVGAKILQVRLDNLRVRDEVAQQWIESWKARWQSWSAERLGHGEAANIFQLEKAKAEAQAEMILKIAQALRSFLGSPTFPRQAISQMLLLRLFSVLDRADFAKSARIFFPAQTLEALKTLQQPGQGGIQPIVTALIANPSSITVTESTTILATIGDGGGNAVPDETEVVFGSSAGVLSDVSVKTVNSVAQTMLTTGSTAGDAQVWARVAGATASMTVKVLPGPPAAVSLLVNPPGTEAGGEIELFAEARDAFGNPVADGTQAIFRATLGRLSASAVESRQGRAQSRLLADGKVGQADVSVQFGQESAQEQVTFLPGSPHSLSLSAVPAEVEVGGDVQIRATVVDAWGNAVADDTTVGFYSSRGSMPSQSQTTGGEAVASLNAGTVAGEVQVSARVAGIAGSMAVRFLPGPPATVSLLVNPLSVDAGGEVELTVEARDSFGNPVVDGTPVYFGTTLGSLSAGSVESRQGRAQSRLLADGKVGQADVSVKVGQESAQEQVAFLPGSPHSLSLTADLAEVEVGGEVQIRATVVDAWGNAVADDTPVAFQTTRGFVSSGLSRALAGEATAFLAVGTDPGYLKVTATAMKANGTIELYVRPGPPALLNLTAPVASILVGRTTELLVLVQDALGNPVADGTEVVFNATEGQVWPPVTHTKSGQAQANLVAPDRRSQVRVSANSGRAQHAIAVEVVSEPPDTTAQVVRT